ncbi:transposase family protein [Streptomyces olivaceoviridis]
MSCDACVGPCGLFPSCPVRGLPAHTSASCSTNSPRVGDRCRAAGAGPKQRLVFVDRLLVTLVHLRLGLPHAALAELYGVDRSTVSNAVREVRALLAARGFAVPDRPGIRLRTLEDVFAYADAEGVRLRIDGTEVQVRRPKAGRPGRRAFISGKKKQNTIKTTTISDGQGRTLFSGVFPTRSTPHRRNRRTTPRWASTTPGASGVAASHRPGSTSSTPTPSTSSGGHCNGSPDEARPTPKPTSPSSASSPTAPPRERPDAARAPNWYSSARPPADRPPADPPGQHARTPIAPKVVTGHGHSRAPPTSAGPRPRAQKGAWRD